MEQTNNDVPKHKLSISLVLAIREDFFSDFDKDLRDLAEKWNVGYQQLRKVAAAQGWHAERRLLRTKFLQELRMKTVEGKDPGLVSAIDQAKLRDFIRVAACEKLISLLQHGIGEHLEGTISQDGCYVPPPVDTIAKLGPVLIRAVEHELKRMGFYSPKFESGANTGPSIDDEAISAAIAKVCGE